jgi:hypothetical protein
MKKTINKDEIGRDYGPEYSDMDYLEQKRDVIVFENGIIIRDFKL